MAAKLKILCAGHLIRFPIGGHTWHHLQYLLGLRRLGHEVLHYEHFGWADSCYDPSRDCMTSDPRYGLDYMRAAFDRSGYDGRWFFEDEAGGTHGTSRNDVNAFAASADLMLNLSNINWTPLMAGCRRRVLVDTDPAFTQIGGHGMSESFKDYHVRFTYGENVHKEFCTMPTLGLKWLPTRQPIVLDRWPVEPGDPTAPLTTVVNWSAYGSVEFEGKLFGQKDREFERLISMPRACGEVMEIMLAGPLEVKRRFLAHGWRVDSPTTVSRDPWTYQNYLRQSRGEFCVAKHGYVSTRCGWFSDRSAAYLASGRPVILQDTGFSQNLRYGEGLFAFESNEEAVSAITGLRRNYPEQCRAARAIAEDYFDSDRVLTSLLERAT